MKTERNDSFDFDQLTNRHNTDSLKWDKYSDTDIIPMWVADMDFVSPVEIQNVLHNRIDHGIFGYSSPGRELIQTVVDYMHKKYNWSIDPDWLIWLPGLVSALNITCRTFGDRNDEVITFVPVYPPFLSAPALSSRKLRTSRLIRKDNRLTFDIQDFKNKITDKTRLIILCNPHNPVGRVYSKQEIQAIAEICLEKNIIICSDEIHCDLILDDLIHVPTASISNKIADNTITLMAPSKTFNLPGLNCAFVIIPNEKLRTQFKKVRQDIVPHVNALGLTACLAAYSKCEHWRQQLISYLRKNRDLVENVINNEMKSLSMEHVEATYLAWINVKNLKLDSPCTFFEKAGVGLFDGRYFDGEGFLRLNFACPRIILTEALNRIRKAVNSLSN